MPLLVSEFDFELPREQIAQQPPPERGSSRMLAVGRSNGVWRDAMFQDLPGLLRAGDVLVLNESKVIPARLFARRKRDSAPAGQCSISERCGESAAFADGRIEVLLTEQVSEWEWRALGKPARKMPVGEELSFASSAGEELLQAVVLGRGEFGERLIRFAPVPDFFASLDEVGHIPLPPYIRRADRPQDRERYQTVFSRQRGSVAAPTAGLHFTGEILDRIRARGVRVCYLTLHVGLGTFQPVRVGEVNDIRLHAERYTLPAETAAEVNQALQEGRRVVAVGTTVVRALEHCAEIGNLQPHSGSTSIFLSPGSEFRVVGALLTNFHLPQSTLLMLVSAFAGRERVLAAYRHAVESGYRFFSYGDCMFLS
ncbi:MAG TPA: tRNA preQ1(34) S-adenosylmethionine ribosyltransferase-isomerase QueA [Acidobacteriaceae bacterium]|nr:tRNA preQ1(34) S-adenosylmethionine ribosyltransferase-isomerase QueA [Acidobacteriaceae bacterium]